MRPRQFTDEEMVQTARRCFLEHGPGVSTNAIAAELGVSSAALFRRVGNKRTLMLRALMPPSVPPFVETLARGPDERPVGEQLEAIAVQIDTFFVELFPLFAVLRAAGLHPQDLLEHMDEPPPAKAVRGLAAWLATLIEQGRIRDVVPSSAAMSFIGGLQGRHFLRFACGQSLPPLDPDFPRTHARIFYRGLAPDSEVTR